MFARAETLFERVAAPALPSAHWVLRAGFAAVFLHKGLSKLFAMGLEPFAMMMITPNFGVDGAPALVLAGLVAFAEVFAGAAILAGGLMRGASGALATRLAGLAALPVLLGAIVTVHWGQWAFMATETHPMGGLEYQVFLAAIALWLALAGARLKTG